MFRALLGVCCALTLAAVAPLAAQAQAPARPPVLAFARLPAVTAAEISPNGQKIAILGGAAENRTITINPIDGAVAVAIPLGNVDVKGIRWGGDSFLIATVRAFDSRKNFEDGRMYSYNIQRDIVFDMQGKIVGMLLDGASWAGFATVRPILGDVEGDKPAVIMMAADMLGQSGYGDTRMKQKGGGLVPALYKVDVASGNGRLIERGKDGTLGWAVDRNGEPRVRLDSDLGFMTLSARRKGAATWTVIDRSPNMALKVEFLGYSDPEDAIYLSAETSAGGQILRHALADGSRTVVGPAKASPDASLKVDPVTGQAVAIITGAEKPEYQWLDPQLGAIHAKLSRGFKGRTVIFAGWSRDRSRIVLRVDAPAAAPAWYLFEPATNQASPLGEEYPELAGAPLGKTSWISYQAKDGTPLNAYLTVPTNLPAGVKAPVIVMPHGGPEARDGYGFDWWEQFLVSRGYAVLKPQFRGSAGFGEAFERAGDNEWGGKMQSDIAEAIDAVTDPAVDTSRVCISGASFGGYSALHGATVRPDRYKCAISVNGVSDLTSMIGHAKIYGGNDSLTIRYWRDVIGDPRNTPDALNAASPFHRVGGRTAPILLIYAANDTTVPNSQSKLMESALSRVGAPYQVVVLDGDDHYFSSTKSRQQTLEATEAFLAKHLPITK